MPNAIWRPRASSFSSLRRWRPSANSRARRVLGNIQHAAERGASLTGHLLAFARRQALVPRMIETQELLEGTSGLLSRSLQSNVTLELGVPNDIWPTVADQNQ